jgi:hypothetical protein
MNSPKPAKPDHSGLANEPRPGLGAREDDGQKPRPKGATQPSPHDREPLGRDAPLPKREPQEQEDNQARETERDTGVSGHSSGD